jgi:hypothetical protein
MACWKSNWQGSLATASSWWNPPEMVIRRCREEIDQHASPEEKANFLAVTQVLTELRYKKQGLLGVLLGILGGQEAMLESPLIQELADKQLHHVVVENRREDILEFLESRFGEVPRTLPNKSDPWPTRPAFGNSSERPVPAQIWRRFAKSSSSREESRGEGREVRAKQGLRAKQGRQE